MNIMERELVAMIGRRTSSIPRDDDFPRLLYSDSMCSKVLLNQQNVNRSGSRTQSSLTLLSTSPVLLTTSRFSEAPLELSQVLSDSARAFSCSPKSICSDRGAYRMLHELTCRIVKFWSRGDLCTDLVPYSGNSGGYGSITTCHFLYHIRLC